MQRLAQTYEAPIPCALGLVQIHALAATRDMQIIQQREAASMHMGGYAQECNDCQEPTIIAAPHPSPFPIDNALRALFITGSWSN